MPDGKRADLEYFADEGRPSGTTGRGVPVLTRDDGMLGLPDDARGSYVDQHGNAGHVATMRERELFVEELPAVIAGYRRLLQSQATRYEQAARNATKLVPR